MDKILKIKLTAIALFVLFSLFSFQEQFSQTPETIYHFDHFKFLIVAIAFGVIITAAIYNLSFYVYIQNKQYLYYGLAQLSTLLMLMNLDSLIIAPFDEIFPFGNYFLLDMSKAFLLFFSLLFIKVFLKEYHVANVIKLINIILIITSMDILLALLLSHTIFTHLVPIFVPIWLVLSEANREIKEKDTPFYFLLIGWYITIGIAIIEFVGFIKMTGIVFPFLHVTFSIESIFLSLAIAYKFKLIEERQKTQQALLLQQSRLASMGEMISIIAHQWKQPLNFLSMVHMNLKKIYPTHPKGDLLLSEANKQIHYMSNTIESFREFYNPSKTKRHFSIQEATQNAIKIVQHALESANITIITSFQGDKTLYGNQNEFEQVILNLLNNAKDALLEKGSNDAQITLTLNDHILTIQDNANGIAKEHLQQIFTPYFSTKTNSDGIGLYISKLIIERELGGRLEVQSHQGEGTLFWVILQ